MKRIRFKFAPLKAHAAIVWMVGQRSDVDLHTILKSCYFADKTHLNAHGRPIFGATYKAMRFGPVPLEIYEMAKGEAYWLPEMGIDEYPWELRGFRLRLTTNLEADFSALSKSNMQALESGFSKSSAMNFDERTAATHGPDWQAAKLGLMAYEDMIDEGPEKADLVADLRETAPYIRL